MKAEAMATGTSKPSARAIVVAQASVTKTPTPHSDTPAPMETGGVGDGQSGAEEVEVGLDEGFQQDRPAKRRRSQSRRHKPRQMLPFPLQNSEGRLTLVSQLYEYAAEQPATHHNAASRGIMHLHLEMLP